MCTFNYDDIIGSYFVKTRLRSAALFEVSLCEAQTRKRRYLEWSITGYILKQAARVLSWTTLSSKTRRFYAAAVPLCVYASVCLCGTVGNIVCIAPPALLPPVAHRCFLISTSMGICLLDCPILMMTSSWNGLIYTLIQILLGGRQASTSATWRGESWTACVLLTPKAGLAWQCLAAKAWQSQTLKRTATRGVALVFGKYAPCTHYYSFSRAHSCSHLLFYPFCKNLSREDCCAPLSLFPPPIMLAQRSHANARMVSISLSPYFELSYIYTAAGQHGHSIRSSRKGSVHPMISCLLTWNHPTSVKAEWSMCKV